jgi:hypothetical protein
MAADTDYIEVFYNRKGLHSTLGYRMWVPKTLSPSATWAYSRIRPVACQNFVQST